MPLSHVCFQPPVFRLFPPQSCEEECWGWYTAQSFYPVSVGEVLHSKYQVLYKLGYGTTATTWLCRDLCRDEYVCMKSMVCDYSSVEREIKAYEVLSKSVKGSRAFGTAYVRQALDHFEISRANRNYHFLIHEPLGVTLQFFLNVSPKKSFPIDYVNDLAYQMLHALDFIHQAKVIHGDVQAKNILLRIQDETILKENEEAEITSPSGRKITERTTIFATRNFPGPLSRWIGIKSQPVLCDFGEARLGKRLHTEHIQPAIYRAPEVFLGLPWSTPVDIWNLGCMVWTFMFNLPLFTRRGAPDEETADRDQLAQTVALLGPPPPTLLADSGKVPNETLESVLATSLKRVDKTMTPEESKAFLAFLRKTLTWTEKERPSASELLKEPWFARIRSRLGSE